MAAKKTEKFGAKSAFVRSMPAGTPAAEVVEAAKKRGIKLTPSLVYNIRSTTKKSSGSTTKGKPGPKTGRKGRRGRRRVRGAASVAAEIHLRNAIASLGLVKSREILAAVEAAFAGN